LQLAADCRLGYKNKINRSLCLFRRFFGQTQVGIGKTTFRQDVLNYSTNRQRTKKAAVNTLDNSGFKIVVVAPPGLNTLFADQCLNMFYNVLPAGFVTINTKSKNIKKHVITRKFVPLFVPLVKVLLSLPKRSNHKL